MRTNQKTNKVGRLLTWTAGAALAVALIAVVPAEAQGRNDKGGGRQVRSGERLQDGSGQGRGQRLRDGSRGRGEGAQLRDGSGRTNGGKRLRDGSCAEK
jgi:hypothetical protein